MPRSGAVFAAAAVVVALGVAAGFAANQVEARHRLVQRAEALRVLEKARILREELVSKNPEDQVWQSGLASVYDYLANLHHHSGRPADAPGG